jgi:hypothetical protein
MPDPDPAVQYRHLVKHFFRRFFDFEAISAPQMDLIEKNVLTFQLLALLVLPGVLKSLFLVPKYGYLIYRPIWERDLAALTDQCFFLSLSMIFVGFITVFEWDMLFPDRKDYLILTHLPIATRTLFYAKVAALAAFLLVITVAIDLCPTFLFPGAVLANNRFGREELGKIITLSFGIRYIVSHGISMLLGNIFIFLSAISLQGALMALRVKPAISRWVRFFCLLLFLFALLSFTQIASVDRLIHTANSFIVFYPPIWFVGVYDVLLGTKDPMLWALAERAFAGLGFACFLSILSYAVCYRRFLNKTIESSSGHLQKTAGIRSLGNWMLDRWIIRNSESRASYHFVAQTLFRSARHTLYITTFLAVGVAIAVMGLATVVVSKERAVTGQLDSVLLSIPLVLTFFLLVGMRVIFAVPVELEANWLFQIAPMHWIKSSHAGVRKYLIGAVILPVYCVAGLVYALVWNWGIAWLHVCFGVTVSCVLMELLLLRFPKIPFTCSYLSGRGQIVLAFPLYFLGFSFFAFGLANLASHLASHTLEMVCFYGIAGPALLLLIRYNNELAATAIRFEEQSEDALILLDLKN